VGRSPIVRLTVCPSLFGGPHSDKKRVTRIVTWRGDKTGDKERVTRIVTWYG